MPWRVPGVRDTVTLTTFGRLAGTVLYSKLSIHFSLKKEDQMRLKPQQSKTSQSSDPAPGGYYWASAPSWMDSRMAGCDVDNWCSEQRACFQRSQPVVKKLQELPRAGFSIPSFPNKRIQGPFPQNSGEDRLLPANAKIYSLPCSDENTFVPRRRRLLPLIQDCGVLHWNYYGETNSCYACKQDCRRIPDVSSVTGRIYSRRKWVPGPGDHLLVGEFDGGMRGPAPLPSQWCKPTPPAPRTALNLGE